MWIREEGDLGVMSHEMVGRQLVASSGPDIQHLRADTPECTKQHSYSYAPPQALLTAMFGVTAPSTNHNPPCTRYPGCAHANPWMRARTPFGMLAGRTSEPVLQPCDFKLPRHVSRCAGNPNTSICVAWCGVGRKSNRHGTYEFKNYFIV